MTRPLAVTAITFLALCAAASRSGAQSPGIRQLRARIAERVAQVPAAEVAVSYRDLGRFDSLDMDADVDFHAASTMKIPVMIEVLRAVDAGRLSLDQRVLLVNRFHSSIDGPAGTRVAHKTGAITATLHDAAIVYPAGRAPYVLVVLTRAIPDEKVATRLSADISRLVWTHAVLDGSTNGAPR